MYLSDMEFLENIKTNFVFFWSTWQTKIELVVQLAV